VGQNSLQNGPLLGCFHPMSILKLESHFGGSIQPYPRKIITVSQNSPPPSPHRCHSAEGIERAAQDKDTEQGWILVKRPRWWRRRKSKSFNPRPSSTPSHGRQRFFERMVGRCFNCLAPGHKLAQCRDPAKCWRCKHSGHISSRCPQPLQRA
jgi:hypothetical protein